MAASVAVIVEHANSSKPIALILLELHISTALATNTDRIKYVGYP